MDPYDNAGLNPFDFRLKCDQKANPLCYNMSDVSVFFNRSDVRSALGVTAEHAPVWANCNATINQDFGADVMRDQAHLVAKALDSGVRVLVYAGEMDYTCNAASNRRWVNALSWEHARSFRKAEEVEADGGEWASKVRHCVF